MASLNLSFDGSNLRRSGKTQMLEGSLSLSRPPPGSAPQGDGYDVFLSFRGTDTRHFFTSFLYRELKHARVHVFKDDEALRSGEEILPSLMIAIEKCRISIPIFSPDYASSKFCLQEIAKIYHCWSSTGQLVLPIFYGIEPFDVRNQTGPFEEPFCRHQHDGVDSEVLQKWKQALKAIGGITGETVTRNKDQAEVVEKIVSKVMTWLAIHDIPVDNDLFGMKQPVDAVIDDHLEGILELLNLEVNDVRIIAISGEDGTGKTTLARILYHQLSSSFEGSSFLTEIDERTSHDDGIKYLRAKMIWDILNRKYEVFQSVIEEIDVMERRFQQMKVLIILDDVTNSSQVEALVGQLDWFGSGSRIIIATQHPVVIPLPHLNYKITTNWISASDNAYKLLSKHTFRKHEPPSNFESLSREIVSSLDGADYPLVAIEIVGSLLYGKDVTEWIKLSRELMWANSLEHILGICFNRLDSKQRKVFLDISCLPSGIDRRIASYLWYDSQHSSDLDDMQALINLMLVKVDASNEIWMHRLVRDFGRKIVCGKGFNGEIVHLTNQKENRSGEDESDDGATMRQRDLIWQQCPTDSPPTLLLECLKVLDMSWSKTTEGWEGWKQLKVPQLRVLNLSGCSNLMVTPVFSFCLDLKMLILEHCPRLVKIDPSIGELRHLNTLKLSCCRELSALPKEVGCLTALTELHLDGTSLRELPVSIGRLKNLHIFTAINCFSLSYLPNSIFSLSSLTVVKLDYANITQLPRTIGQNMKLQHLSLRCCHGITRLPSLVGEVEGSLVELDVSMTGISELPKWITNLKALRVLKMEYCFITEFPLHFGELRRLEEIHASRCRNLANLPDDVGKLESLRILDIGESCVSSLPQSIRALSHLETLDCTSCNMLQSLPELPSSLTYVHVESKDLPDLVNLKQLKEFTLGSDKIVNLRALSNVPNIEKDGSFDWLPESSLRTLRLSLPLIENLPGFPDSLRKLSLHCTKLKHIPPLPSTLVVLSIQDCRSLEKMPSLENLVNLQELEILDCPEINKIEGLESLQELRVLTISSSGIVSLKGLENLTALNRLTLLDCGSLSDELPYLSTLKGVAVNIGS